MSKRFTNDLCAYCAKKAAVTGDHIFARKFFLAARRANLPQAPICGDCNNKKSQLEHYLTAVLPFGARHADALTNLASMVPKRLQKNIKLHRHLAESHTESAIPIEGEKLEQLFGLIALGLVWYHWKVYLNHDSHVVRSTTASPRGAQVLDACIFKQKARNRVNENIGNRTFEYEGIQANDDPALKLVIYTAVDVAAGD